MLLRPKGHSKNKTEKERYILKQECQMKRERARDKLTCNQAWGVSSECKRRLARETLSMRD